jgi:hypothetical protein
MTIVSLPTPDGHQLWLAQLIGTQYISERDGGSFSSHFSFAQVVMAANYDDAVAQAQEKINQYKKGYQIGDSRIVAQPLPLESLLVMRDRRQEGIHTSEIHPVPEEVTITGRHEGEYRLAVVLVRD